jgi:hypothetical protein
VPTIDIHSAELCACPASPHPLIGGPSGRTTPTCYRLLAGGRMSCDEKPVVPLLEQHGRLPRAGPRPTSPQVAMSRYIANTSLRTSRTKQCATCHVRVRAPPAPRRGVQPSSYTTGAGPSHNRELKGKHRAADLHRKSVGDRLHKPPPGAWPV